MRIFFFYSLVSRQNYVMDAKNMANRVHNIIVYTRTYVYYTIITFELYINYKFFIMKKLILNVSCYNGKYIIYNDRYRLNFQFTQ